VSSDGRIACGQNPVAGSHLFDFEREKFVESVSAARGLNSSHENVSPQVPPVAPPVDAGRTTGLYTVEIRGSARNYKSLKQLLSETLLFLGEADEGFFDRVALEKTRSRRLIARRPESLFDNKALASNAAKYAKKLPNGWWLNTNNSTEQVKFWFGVIARCANLSWNKDIRVSF
jgi:hypothetical protein